MNSGELSLQDYVDILVRRWRILAVILGLALAAAVVATLRTETVYRAEAEVLHLVFFATWCPPCVQELERLADLEERWGNRGYRLVLVAVRNRHTLCLLYTSPSPRDS